METSAAAGLARGSGLVETAKRAFFRSFFRLLIAFVALAEWVSVAWALRAVGVHVPLPLHVAVPFAIFQLNRWILVRRRLARRRLDAVVRGYVAFAFTSMFCTLFLGLAGVGGLILLPILPAPFARAYPWLVDAGFLGTAGLLAYGYVFGTRELAVSRIAVPIAGLPAPFAGLRIVHISDLHIGPNLDVTELAEHVCRVNALEPDLICITGDLVDRPETCALGFPTLAGLRARHGVLVTLGNHDVYAGADFVTAALVGSSRVDLQACKLEYSIVSPK